jgi:hypothetical protein
MKARLQLSRILPSGRLDPGRRHLASRRAAGTAIANAATRERADLIAVGQTPALHATVAKLETEVEGDADFQKARQLF